MALTANDKIKCQRANEGRTTCRPGKFPGSRKRNPSRRLTGVFKWGAAQSEGQRSTAEQCPICPVIHKPEGRAAGESFSEAFYVYTHK